MTDTTSSTSPSRRCCSGVKLSRADPADRAGRSASRLAVPVGDPDPGGHAQLRAEGDRRRRRDPAVRQLDAARAGQLHGAALHARCRPSCGPAEADERRRAGPGPAGAAARLGPGRSLARHRAAVLVLGPCPARSRPCCRSRWRCRCWAAPTSTLPSTDTAAVVTALVWQVLTGAALGLPLLPDLRRRADGRRPDRRLGRFLARLRPTTRLDAERQLGHGPALPDDRPGAAARLRAAISLSCKGSWRRTSWCRSTAAWTSGRSPRR